MLVGCGHRATPTPLPGDWDQLPRGDDWDSFRGDWKLIGFITEHGYSFGAEGTDVSAFLRIRGMRVDAESICLEYLDEKPEYRATYRVVSPHDPIALHLRSEQEGMAGELGAIATGSGNRLVVCFSLLKVPVGGKVPYPEQFRSVQDSLCLAFSRR